MSQNYLTTSNLFKAQVLMASTLTREKRSILDSGRSYFDYQIPTLTIGGSMDGAARISRVAEQYWH